MPLASSAAYLDFTSDTLLNSLTPAVDDTANISVYSGEIGGIGFTLSSNGGFITFKRDGKYDGREQNGCDPNGPLACDWDGAGIGTDEITGINTETGEILSLVFEQIVSVSSFEFLDLYKTDNGKETVFLSVDGSAFDDVMFW